MRDTHVVFNFEVIVKREAWKLSGNATFDLAILFHAPRYGDLLLHLDFQPIKYIVLMHVTVKMLL